MRIAIAVFAVLLGSFWLGSRPSEPPQFTCYKPARECAMDRATCKDGSCEDFMRIAGAK